MIKQLYISHCGIKWNEKTRRFNKNRTFTACECACGKICFLNDSSLRANVQSCGCRAKAIHSAFMRGPSAKRQTGCSGDEC